MTKARDLGDFISDGTIAETVTADGLNLGDNEKIQLGASQDLQIYHTGSTSYIFEQGTGDLRIRGNQVRIEDGDGSTIALFQNDAGAQLRYDGTTILETTTTGATVTGTIAVSGSFNATSGTFTVQDNGTDILNVTSTLMSPQTDGAISLGSSSNGFNELYLDGSAYVGGNVGIGVTSISDKLQILGGGSSNTTGITFTNNNGTDNIGNSITFRGSYGAPFSTDNLYARISGLITNYSGSKTGNLVFSTGSNNSISERMRIDSSGNVSIKTTSANYTLNVQGANNIASFISDASGSQLNIISQTVGSVGVFSGSSDDLRLGTDSTERFRIGTSGQLGIGGATYGTAGQVLTSGGSGAAPTWEDAAGGGAAFSAF